MIVDAMTSAETLDRGLNDGKTGERIVHLDLGIDVADDLINRVQFDSTSEGPPLFAMKRYFH